MGPSHYRELSELILDSALNPAAWPRTLEQLRRELGAACVDLYMHRGDSLIFSAMGGFPEACMSEYVASYLGREPRSQFLASAQPSVVVTDRDLVSPEVLSRHPYYQDFLARWGLGECIANAPVKNGDKVAYLGVHYERGRGPPPDRAVVIVRHLRDQLSRALAVQYRLAEAQTTLELSTFALDRLNCAVMMVDKSNRLLIANQVAEHELHSGQFVCLRRNRLHAAIGESESNLKGVLTAKDDRALRVAVVSGVDGRRAQLVGFETPPSLRDSSSVATIVFLLPVDYRLNEYHRELLKVAFELTESETRLSLALAEGMGLRDYARTTGLSYHTVRSVLKVVFEKTGSSRQGELVAQLRALVSPMVAS